MPSQIPRRISHQKRKINPKGFDYSLQYEKLDLRRRTDLYRVGVGEQGVLLVQPYKRELLPEWRFRTPLHAKTSANALLRKFRTYHRNGDFVGMDMARKYLQMGYTRSRRYANHRSGHKYDAENHVLPFEADIEKAASAEIFRRAWQEAEALPDYVFLKALWRAAFG